MLALAIDGSGGAHADPLPGSEWQPLQGRLLEDGGDLFVRFEAAGRLTGHGGCNDFTGSYAVSSSWLVIGPPVTGYLTCAAPVMALESGFLQALARTRGFTREGTRLELRDGQGNPLASLRQSDRD